MIQSSTLQPSTPHAPFDTDLAPIDTYDARDGILLIGAVTDTGDLSTDRLRELGLVEGRTVSIVRRGNPAIVEIDGARMALAGCLQRCVLALPITA